MLYTLAAGGPEVERRLVIVLIQLSIIIFAARVFAELFRRLGQPMVVGEILAGIILGPSLFGHFFPELSHRIFNPEVAPIFQILSQLGLILLLFLIGLEFDFSHLKMHGKASVAVSLTGMILPFALGFVLGWQVHPILAPTVNHLGFSLFMGTAMSITAIPILGRIMMELNLTRTKVGAITITAAAVDDAMGWILLATVSAMVGSDFQLWGTLQMILLTLGFFLLVMYVLRPVLVKLIRLALPEGKSELKLNHMAALLIVLFLCAIATSLIGIFAIFGAFLMGAALSTEERFRESVSRQLTGFVTVFFLPIFFTYTGLRTNIGSLATPQLWLLAALVLGVAVFGKFVGCSLAARLTGFSTREAACIGIMMNTRALMELIVINVGKDLGIIPDSMFCMLVIMALTTTVMTTPVLLAMMPGTDLEQSYRRSPFFLQRSGAA